MDIERDVKRMRELSQAINDPANKDIVAQLAEEMAAVWDGLDGWMSRGSFLPVSWDRNRPKVS
jgi:hypothetical protein